MSLAFGGAQESLLDHRADLCMGDAGFLPPAARAAEYLQELRSAGDYGGSDRNRAGREEVTPLQVSLLLVLAATLIGSFGAVFLKMGAIRINTSVLSFANSRLLLG